MLELIVGATLEIETNDMDAVDVADEVVVEEMVIRLSGKLPHAQFPNSPKGALQSCKRIRIVFAIKPRGESVFPWFGHKALL